MIPLSIIIPAWNESALIEQTLQGVLDTEYDQRKMEVVVVAGGTDRTFEVAQGFSSAMTAIDRYSVLLQRPDGKNAAIQDGIRSARNPVIVLLDGDTLLTRDTLTQLVTPLEVERCDLTIANPFPVKRTWVSEYYMIPKEYDLERISTYPGNAMAFKADLVTDRLSYYFDETVPVGVDYLLADRLRKDGKTLRFVPNAKVFTWIPSTLRHFLLNDLRWLSAYIGLAGVKWQVLGANILIAASLISLIPFSTWQLAAALIVHSLYLLKKGRVFFTVLNGDKTGWRFLPGFLALSYAHQLLGLLAHIRYFSGACRKQNLSQGERPA